MLNQPNIYVERIPEVVASVQKIVDIKPLSGPRRYGRPGEQKEGEYITIYK